MTVSDEFNGEISSGYRPDQYKNLYLTRVRSYRSDSDLIIFGCRSRRGDRRKITQ